MTEFNQFGRFGRSSMDGSPTKHVAPAPPRGHRTVGSQSLAGRAWRIGGTLLAALALAAAMTLPALAIPSPELLVGSLTSLSQLGAIASALLGGGAAIALKRGGGASPAASRRRQRWLLALVATSVLLAGLNIYQWVTHANAVQLRLSATLTRPTRLAGQPILDPTLKVLSAREQASHPLGLTPAEAERWIREGDAKPFEILDIRESAEVEMGTFERARAVRYPDLLQGGVEVRGRTALLICHNGNRSSETCQKLAARGIDCRFLIGGLERWITEQRSAGGFSRSKLVNSRALPAYPNNTRLLETAEVEDLHRQGNVVFVDVRYPGQFASGHLPGAINMPVRRMTSAALEQAIAALPKRPIVVPCYERRSCFFGELLGLMAWRKGLDFRGRYTLPWEFGSRPPPPPHVAALMAEANLGWWGRVQRWLAIWLNEQAAVWGFVPVLLAMAALSRLVILPFALKAERDQLTARAIEPEVRRLKEQLAGDPKRHARALRQLYRRYGMTPLRNLLALAGLPILMLAGAALGDAAALGQYRLGGIGALGQPDPTYLLAVCCGLLIGLYVDWAMAQTGRQQAFVWLVVAPGLGAMMAFLPAAMSLYLVVSVALMLVQRLVVLRPGWIAKRAVGLSRASATSYASNGLARLGDAQHLAGVGNKARRLGQLLAAGIRVPPGAVLTPAFLGRWQGAGADERKRLANAVRRIAGRGPWAVRSSGAAEDGAGLSHAGVYMTQTDVERAGLAQAIDAVIEGFRSARASSYTDTGTMKSCGAGQSVAITQADAGSIVVQRMISAEYAGVLFTRAPDAPGLALLEMVQGAGELLVSGLATPDSFRFGRRTGRPVGTAAPPIDVAPLLAAGQRIEGLFGQAQDIEWVWAKGRFSIVQSRDITADATGMPRALLAEWERALALAQGDHGRQDEAVSVRHGTRRRHGRHESEAIVLARNEMADLLPKPTPLTRSLIEALHAAGGSVDLACRRLGLAYHVDEAGPDLFPTLFGRLYHDRREAARRAPRISRLQMRRLSRQGKDVDRRFRGEIMPELSARLAMPAVAAFEAMATHDLMAAIRALHASFVTETHVEAEIINIVTEVTNQDVRAALEAAGLEPTQWLSRRGRSLVEQAAARAAVLPPEHRRQTLAWDLGHRAFLDYELAAPRLLETPEQVEAYAAAFATPGHTATADRDLSQLPKALRKRVGVAGRLQTLKEDAKHVVLVELAILRRALMALDRRLELEGGVFLLTFDEIFAGLLEDRIALRQRVDERRAQQTAFAGVGALPGEMSLALLERLSSPAAAKLETAVNAGGLAGTRVAGTQSVIGRAYSVPAELADSGAPLKGFKTGDILVTPFVHPAWLGDVLRAGGVVAGTGGWLSHMAIVARERNVAMVVGVAGWQNIATGQMLALGLDGHIEVNPEHGQ